MVAEEAVVLGGEHGVAHALGDLLESHGNEPLLADLRDELAAATVDAHGHLQLDPAHGFGRGQRGGDVDISAGDGDGAEPDEAQNRGQDKTDQGERGSFHGFEGTRLRGALAGVRVRKVQTAR